MSGRTAKRPRFTPTDRALLVLLAGRVRAGRPAVLLVQPETILRWHRTGFRLLWRWKSAPRCRRPRVPQATVALIQRMARENRLWGAERLANRHVVGVRVKQGRHALDRAGLRGVLALRALLRSGRWEAWWERQTLPIELDL